MAPTSFPEYFLARPRAARLQNKPGIVQLIITRGQTNFTIVFALARSEKILCRFGRTPNFWVLHVPRARILPAPLVFIALYEKKPGNKVMFCYRGAYHKHTSVQA